MSWHFEIHRGGRGEYQPGESDRFEPLDVTAAREVLASVRDRVDVDVFPGEHDDEVQWVGDAYVVEVTLFRSPDGLLRLIGAGFRSTGEGREREEVEERALLELIFDLADRVGAEVYDQEGSRLTRAEYGLERGDSAEVNR